MGKIHTLTVQLKELLCQTYTGTYLIRRKSQMGYLLKNFGSNSTTLPLLKVLARFWAVVVIDIFIGFQLTSLFKEDLLLPDKLAANALYFADLIVYWLKRWEVFLPKIYLYFFKVGTFFQANCLAHGCTCGFKAELSFKPKSRTFLFIPHSFVGELLTRGDTAPFEHHL